MSHPGPRAVEIALSDEERRTLERWAGGVEARVALRSRIVLACSDGLSNAAVADKLAVSRATVVAWRGRFVRERLAGLRDEPRTGRSKAELVLSDEERVQLTRWARRAKSAQFLGDAGEDCAGVRRGGVEQTSGSGLGCERDRGEPVAGTLCAVAGGWPAG